MGERLTVRRRNRRNFSETGQFVIRPVSGNQERVHGFDQG